MLDILCACRVVGLNKMRKPLTGFRGPDIILPPVAAQVLLLCKIERRQLSASRLYGFMLRVTGCEGLSAVFFQQSSCGLNLFTRFTARLLLYQASPNWVISRCLYRAAHCHVHTLHSLPVSFWQYIIFFFLFRLLLFSQSPAAMLIWVLKVAWGCKYRSPQQFEFMRPNDISRVYLG